jgi:acetoin utilization protein AcuB
MTLETIMSTQVATVTLDDTLFAVRELFEQRQFHHAVVTADGRVVGVISDRDLLRNISPFVGKLSERRQDVASLSKRVHQVMTRRLVWASPGMTIQEAAGLLIRHRISCLPVLDATGACVGIVTSYDIMRWLAEEATCQPRSGTERRAA